MRHQVAGRKLSRTAGHRKALYRNLVMSLLEHEKMVTTEAKAREIRGLAEKMITLGKEGSVASRRQALAFVGNGKIVKKLFDDIALRYNDRQGGYTRIVKLGFRSGDSAPVARIELV